MKQTIKHSVLAGALAAGMVLSGTASAQVVGVDLSTGDVVVDQRIGYQNRVDRVAFLDHLVDEFGGERDFYLGLLNDGTLSQSELYYACSVGAVSGVSCASVIDQRLDLRRQGQGWGVLAQRYGIKPGSARFHALKSRIGGDDYHISPAMMGSHDGPGKRHDSHAGKHHGKPMNKAKKSKKDKVRGGRGD